MGCRQQLSPENQVTENHALWVNVPSHLPPRGAWFSFCALGLSSGQCKNILKKLKQRKNTK